MRLLAHERIEKAENESEKKRKVDTGLITKMAISTEKSEKWNRTRTEMNAHGQQGDSTTIKPVERTDGVPRERGAESSSVSSFNKHIWQDLTNN